MKAQDRQAPGEHLKLSSLARALRDPSRAVRRAVDRLAGRTPTETQPVQLFEALSRRSRAAGITGINVILSFDCDTPEDAAAAQDVFAQLSRRGVPTTFAVPGVTLASAAERYQRLSRDGARFINHGNAPHTEFRDGRYQAVTFYNELSDDTVMQDIRDGHKTVANVIGAPPTGFRAPHFGYYQLPEQRAVVYSVARELGYAFCSDTLPQRAYDSGPIFEVSRGLKELPLTGSLNEPHVILDSWNYLADRTQYRLREDYATRFAETVNFFSERRLSVLLNYYADPAHVVGSDIFFRAIDQALATGARFRSFEDVLQMTGGR